MRIALFFLLPAFLLAANLQVSASPNAACAVALSDGRSFLTGGRATTNSLPLAAYFEKDGTVSPASPMVEARAGHVCVGFPDGSVLVAGGDTGKRGATNSAEVYHADTNSWTATGAMLTARTGAAAILLKNGKVLVARRRVGGRARQHARNLRSSAGALRTGAGDTLRPAVPPRHRRPRKRPRA